MPGPVLHPAVLAPLRTHLTAGRVPVAMLCAGAVTVAAALAWSSRPVAPKPMVESESAPVETRSAPLVRAPLPVTAPIGVIDPAEDPDEESRPEFSPPDLDMAAVLHEGGLRVLLHSEVAATWLGSTTPRVRVVDTLTVVTRPLTAAAPRELHRVVGSRLRLHGPDGRTCLTRVTRVIALGRFESEEEPAQLRADPRGTWDRALGSYVVAGDLEPIEGSCAGTAWARREELPAPAMATVQKAPRSIRRAAEQALRALPEYAETVAPHRPGDPDELFDVRLLSIPGGETIAVSTVLVIGCSDPTPALTAFWRLGAGDHLELLGTGATVLEIVAAADADGDGAIEMIFRDDYMIISVARRGPGSYRVAESAVVPIHYCTC